MRSGSQSAQGSSSPCRASARPATTRFCPCGFRSDRPETITFLTVGSVRCPRSDHYVLCLNWCPPRRSADDSHHEHQIYGHQFRIVDRRQLTETADLRGHWYIFRLTTTDPENRRFEPCLSRFDRTMRCRQPWRATAQAPSNSGQCATALLAFAATAGL